MASPRLDELAERLGIVLRHPEAIGQAFIHSSFQNENPDFAAGHNERLEFFGDAVIGFVVSRLLYDTYPNEDEGFLTARRASLVNRDSLAALALQLGLDRYLLLGKGEAEGGGAARPSVLAATFEALAGAIAIAEGATATGEWLAPLFMEQLRRAEADGPPKSSKSRLQEWAQRFHHVKPQYRLVAAIGPAHRQAFEVEVTVTGVVSERGEGSSRQRAEESAAATALAAIERLGISAAGTGA